MKSAVILLFAVIAVLPAAAQPAERLTLAEAIRTALSQNPEVGIAQSRISSARAGLRQANAAFWPQVQVSSHYTRTNNPASVFGMILAQRDFSMEQDFNDPDDTDDLDLRASLNLALFAGGRNMAGREAAAAAAQAADYGSAAVRNVLAFETAKAFYSAVKAQRFLEAASAGVRTIGANHETATRLFQAGTVLKTDVLDVGVQLARAKEDESRARNGASLSRKALAAVMGLTEIPEIDPRVPEPVPPAGASYDRHPELLAAKQVTEAAQAGVRRARAGYFPQLSAFANVDHNRGWETGAEGDSWTAGVMAKMDLWDGMLTSGRVQQAEAELESARQEMRKVRLRLDLELEQARQNLGDAEQRTGVSRQSVSQAEESAQLTRARYQQGLATATQLMNAETALIVAQVRFAEAEADRRIAVAALRKALGLGID